MHKRLSKNTIQFQKFPSIIQFDYDKEKRTRFLRFFLWFLVTSAISRLFCMQNALERKVVLTNVLIIFHPRLAAIKTFRLLYIELHNVFIVYHKSIIPVVEHLCKSAGSLDDRVHHMKSLFVFPTTKSVKPTDTAKKIK